MSNQLWFKILSIFSVILVLIITAIVFSLRTTSNITLITPNKPTNSFIDSTKTAHQKQPVSIEKIKQWVYQPYTMDQGQSYPFLQTLPLSLVNTPKPEKLDIDIQQQLVMNKKVRHLFDFYLSAIGEEALHQIIIRIKYELKQQLPQPALTQGIQLLEQYLQYKNNIENIINNYLSYDDAIHEMPVHAIRAAKQGVISSRQDFFSADIAEIFFEREDIYDEYMLNRRQIQLDQSLNSEQKQFLLAELALQAPEWITKQHYTANNLNDFIKLEKDLKAQGYSQNHIDDIRERTFGPNTADRLKQLNIERKQWNLRLGQYRQKLQSILQNETLNESEKLFAVRSLRQDLFSPQEIIRIKALDRITIGSSL